MENTKSSRIAACVLTDVLTRTEQARPKRRWWAQTETTSNDRGRKPWIKQRLLSLLNVGRYPNIQNKYSRLHCDTSDRHRVVVWCLVQTGPDWGYKTKQLHCCCSQSPWNCWEKLCDIDVPANITWVQFEGYFFPAARATPVYRQE